MGVDAPNTEKAGLKFDGGKRRYSLLPHGFVGAVVDVLEHGARKYSANSWQAVEDGRTRYYDALCRHLEAWRGGELLDPDTGLPHMAHIACNAAFLYWFDMQLVKNT